METSKDLKVSWTSPSNIALVKYWGKIPVQIPANPSISFTLSHSKTQMSIEAFYQNKNEVSLDFFFEGSLNEKFREKILNFLKSQIKRFPWLLNYHLTIHSSNTFPHSSGIASSASSMSALNLCLISLDEKIMDIQKKSEDFFRESSNLSRLASGSACRSIYPFLATWGKIDGLSHTSDEFASPLDKAAVHENFFNYCDSIIIVDEKEKSVSSRAGHALMDNHPFAKERFLRAKLNLKRLLTALKTGDYNTFIEVVEEEALMLHALMMTSMPSYILLKPDSLLLIEKIREFRENKKIPVCFTIDAGPNIHLLYPKSHQGDVIKWLNQDLGKFRVIHDEVGDGPVRLKD